MDRAIVHYAHGFIGRVPVLDGFAVFFASYFPYLFILAFMCLPYTQGAWVGLYGLPRKRARLQFFLTAFLAVLIASGIVAPLIHYLYGRPRPFAEFGWEPLFAHDANPSFPSSHATLLFTLAASMWQLHKKWGYWFAGFALVIGVGRVYSLVHYPTDIIFGALIGVCAVYAVSRTLRFK